MSLQQHQFFNKRKMKEIHKNILWDTKEHLYTMKAASRRTLSNRKTAICKTLSTGKNNYKGDKTLKLNKLCNDIN